MPPAGSSTTRALLLAGLKGPTGSTTSLPTAGRYMRPIYLPLFGWRWDPHRHSLQVVPLASCNDSLLCPLQVAGAPVAHVPQ
jgi:hypothetical protein